MKSFQKVGWVKETSVRSGICLATDNSWLVCMLRLPFVMFQQEAEVKSTSFPGAYLADGEVVWEQAGLRCK